MYMYMMIGIFYYKLHTCIQIDIYASMCACMFLCTCIILCTCTCIYYMYMYMAVMYCLIYMFTSLTQFPTVNYFSPASTQNTAPVRSLKGHKKHSDPDFELYVHAITLH